MNQKLYPVFPETPRNSYGKYTWRAEKHQMEMTHLPGGQIRWTIFEISHENPEKQHLREIYSTTHPDWARDKWVELTMPANGDAHTCGTT